MSDERVVIDANILFSSLLSKNASQRKVILSKRYAMYSPNYVFVELFTHKEKLLKHAKASESDVYDYLTAILNHIRFIPPELVSIENRRAAYLLCGDVDPSDIPFVSLALELNALLWTGDKALKKGLITKGFDRFF